MPRIVACGSRNGAYADFCTALKSLAPGDFVALLIDSERPVPSDASLWVFLADPAYDGWAQPLKAGEENLHLMVQCMEAWLLADRAALERFFGQGFRLNVLPAQQDVESIPKGRLIESLKSASRGSQTKGPYHKGKHSYDLLGMSDPTVLRQACVFARRFLDTLAVQLR